MTPTTSATPPTITRQTSAGQSVAASGVSFAGPVGRPPAQAAGTTARTAAATISARSTSRTTMLTPSDRVGDVRRLDKPSLPLGMRQAPPGLPEGGSFGQWTGSVREFAVLAGEVKQRPP